MKKQLYFKALILAAIILFIVPMVTAQPLTNFDPYTGAAIFCFINVGVFLIMFWLINNFRVNVEKFFQKFQDGASKRVVGAIKTEMFFKAVGLFCIAILNLMVCGFFYHAWTEVETVGTELAFMFFVMNCIVIFALFLMFIIQIFYFPFQFVKETAENFMERVDR